MIEPWVIVFCPTRIFLMAVKDHFGWFAEISGIVYEIVVSFLVVITKMPNENIKLNFGNQPSYLDIKYIFFKFVVKAYLMKYTASTVAEFEYKCKWTLMLYLLLNLF